eukprot:gene19474-25356_t
MSGRDALEVRENIARISSKIPGFGPPDVTYPFYYEGQWNTKQSFNDIVIPGNNKRVISFNWPISYIKYENNIVLDRASTTTSEYSSLLNPVFPISSTWDPINPNVLTVNSFDGSIEEKRVTKRSVETFSPEESGITSDRPYPLALGYSEFSRIALTTAQGIQSAVPQVFAVRLLARLKGLKVHHSINEFSVGEEVILTLADSEILQKDENGYDDDEFENNGVVLGAKRSILSHYDKIQPKGPKYIIGSNSMEVDENDRGTRNKNATNQVTVEEINRMRSFEQAKSIAKEKSAANIGPSNSLADSAANQSRPSIITAYDRAIQQSIERMQRISALKNDTSNNNDNGAKQIFELIEKQKQLTNGINESKMEEESNNNDINEVDAEGRKKDGKLVFSKTTEFASRLQSLLNDKARELAEDAVRDELNHNNKSKEIISSADVNDKDENNGKGGWVHDIKEVDNMDIPEEDNESDIDNDDTIINKETKSKSNDLDNQLSFLHRQPLASQSTAAALALLKGSGELKKRDELAGRALDPREKEEVDPKDRIKLEYRDEYGRKLTKKEAFRQLCYRFHGYGPGKQKKDKRIKADNIQRKAGTSLDALNNVTMKSLTRAQEATGKAHITISGGTSSAASFSAVTANLIAKLKKKKKDSNQKSKKV